MSDLDLREVDGEPVRGDRIQDGITVEVYSEKLGEGLLLRVTHTEETLGGVISGDPASPLVSEGDHVHFFPKNVLAITKPE